MIMAPPSRVVSFFQLHPLFLLLPLLLVQTASVSPLSANHRRPNLAFGGRYDNITSKPLSPDFKTYFYRQPLDHYNHMSEGYKTFKQRFIMNRKYFDEANDSSPIIAYFGSEGPLDVQSAGFVNDLCRKFGGLGVYIEHRFFGQSNPLGSMDEILENDTIRGFFNPAQVLADNAEILLYVMRTFHKTYPPVFVLGASYGGMLASWFRLKYPHIAMAGVASSAPVWYFDKSTSQDGYNRVISDDFRNVSKNCYQSIRNSWAKIDEIASEPDGLFDLSRKFRTCSQLNGSSELKEYLVSTYTYAALYNDPPLYPVSMICKGIDDASNEKGDVLDRVFAGLVSYRGNQTCYDVDYYNGPSESARGWEWLACSEIMMHIGGGTNDTMFEGNKRFQMGRLRRRCKGMFNVTSRPWWLTTYYGGRDNRLYLKRFGSNIVFTNGLKDPYSNAGVLEDINDSIVAITTANGSHALDMVAASDTDPEWLVDQRNTVINFLQKWLAQYYSDLQDYLKNQNDKSPL